MNYSRRRKDQHTNDDNPYRPKKSEFESKTPETLPTSPETLPSETKTDWGASTLPTRPRRQLSRQVRGLSGSYIVELTGVWLLAYQGNDYPLREHLLEEPELIALGSRRVDNKSVLHLAAQEGNKSTVDMLLRMGADPFQKDEFERNPLMLAAKHNRPTVCEILIEAMLGVKPGVVNEVDSYEMTALMFAVENSALSVVNVLMRFAPDLEVRCCCGLWVVVVVLTDCYFAV